MLAKRWWVGGLVFLFLFVLLISISTSDTLAQDADTKRAAGPAKLGAAEPLAIEKFLEKKVSLAVKDAPLKDVVKDLSKQAGVAIAIDIRSLDDVGLTADAPISLQIKNISLRSMLHHVGEQNDLVFETDDRNIIFTTYESAEQSVHPRTYFAGDWGTQLDGLILTTIAPDTWEELGGPSSIREFGTLLVVNTTDHVHGQVDQLMNQLQQLLDLTWADKPLPVSLPVAHQLASTQHLRQALGKEVKLVDEDKEISLDDFVQRIKAQLPDVPVIIDDAALDNHGLSADLMIALPAIKQPLADWLKILDAYGLSYRLYNEVIQLSSKDACEANLVTVIYPVGDLLTSLPKAIDWPYPALRFIDRPGQNAGLDGITIINGLSLNGPLCDFDDLDDMVRTMVQPDTWDVLGGPSTMSFFAPLECMVCSTTETAHRQIERLLNELRKRSDMQAHNDVQLETLADTVITVAFRARNNSADMETIAENIKNVIEPKSWFSEQQRIGIVKSSTEGDVMVVRNRLDIIQQVTRHLMRLKLIHDPTAPIFYPHDQSSGGVTGGFQ